MNKKLSETNEAKSSLLSSEVDKKVEKIIGSIDDPLRNKIDVQGGLTILRQAVQDYKYIDSLIISSKPNSGFTYNDKIKLENERLGEIDHTFKSALSNLKSWGTWLSAFVSLLI